MRAYSAIANGGRLVQPRIVRALITEGGVSEFAPLWGNRVISEESARTMRFMMQAVVDGVRGHPAQISGWPIAGKSGTSDVVESGKYIEGEAIASFAGFAPADDPRIVMLVKIDRPQGEIFGGVVAAPVFSRLMAQVLPYLGVPPSSYVAEPTIFDPPSRYPNRRLRPGYRNRSTMDRESRTREMAAREVARKTSLSIRLRGIRPPTRPRAAMAP